MSENFRRNKPFNTKTMKKLFQLLLSLCALPYSTRAELPARDSLTPLFDRDTMTWFDSARQRPVPVAIYSPYKEVVHPKVVIFSHGYGANEGGANLAYSYLTEYLATQGYWVVSIQHELKTDSLMPTSGIPQIVRRPFWERGVENIWFVINTLKKKYPDLDITHLTLIGHSNGGDMSALFEPKHPGVAEKIISLDNRRMALPRTNHPRVYSLRSSDLPADEGVLPPPEEQKQFGITIVKLPNTRHVEMSDDANAAQRAEINGYVLRFLKE